MDKITLLTGYNDPHIVTTKQTLCQIEYFQSLIEYNNNNVELFIDMDYDVLYDIVEYLRNDDTYVMKQESIQTLNRVINNMSEYIYNKDDIINIDVGGKIFRTTKKTLCNCTYFNAMFNRFNNDSQDIFIDRSPEAFKHILSFLRNNSYIIDDKYSHDIIFFGINEIDFDIDNNNKTNMQITQEAKKFMYGNSNINDFYDYDTIENDSRYRDRIYNGILSPNSPYTQNPQITFFRAIYRRHTPFQIFYHKIKLENNIFTKKIDEKFIRQMYIKTSDIDSIEHISYTIHDVEMIFPSNLLKIYSKLNNEHDNNDNNNLYEIPFYNGINEPIPLETNNILTVSVKPKENITKQINAILYVRTQQMSILEYRRFKIKSMIDYSVLVHKHYKELTFDSPDIEVDIEMPCEMLYSKGFESPNISITPNELIYPKIRYMIIHIKSDGNDNVDLLSSGKVMCNGHIVKYFDPVTSIIESKFRYNTNTYVVSWAFNQLNHQPSGHFDTHGNNIKVCLELNCSHGEIGIYCMTQRLMIAKGDEEYLMNLHQINNDIVNNNIVNNNANNNIVNNMDIIDLDMIINTNNNANNNTNNNTNEQ